MAQHLGHEYVLCSATNHAAQCRICCGVRIAAISTRKVFYEEEAYRVCFHCCPCFKFARTCSGVCPHWASSSTCSRSGSTAASFWIRLAARLPSLGRHSLRVGSGSVCSAAASIRSLGSRSLAEQSARIYLDRRSLAISPSEEDRVDDLLSCFRCARGSWGHAAFGRQDLKFRLAFLLRYASGAESGTTPCGQHWSIPMRNDTPTLGRNCAARETEPTAEAHESSVTGLSRSTSPDLRRY